MVKSNVHLYIVYCLKTYADGQSSTENLRAGVANFSLGSTMSVAASFSFLRTNGRAIRGDKEYNLPEVRKPRTQLCCLL